MLLPRFSAHRRLLGTCVLVVITVGTGALLAATIYWTAFDPRWGVFLGGVLFAALPSLAVRMSRTEWRLLRRTKEVERLRARLREELDRGHAAAAAYRALEARLAAAEGGRRDSSGHSSDGEDAPGPSAGVVAREGAAEAVYLHSLAAELTGWGDPRAKLADALRNDGFLLLAQRIAPLPGAPREPACYEIFLRLREEEDNQLPPGGFFPVAERHGMMEAIDRWVVRHVIGRLLALRTAGQPVPLCCINLSSASLESAPFAHFVEQQLKASGIEGRHLGFEIAEDDLIHRHARVAAFIAAVRRLGCRVTADAFGSVKGSFASFGGVALDFVKIDGVIVQNLRNPAELARARAIQAACRQSGVLTIGEMVEDRATLLQLRELGIDYAQGFGVALPVPIGRIAGAAVRV